MAILDHLRALVGTELTGFRIEILAEVYRTNEEGQRTESLGYTRDPVIARMYASQQKRPFFVEVTTDVLVLTDGKVAYRLPKEGIQVLDEDHILENSRERALAKLTLADRTILGLQ